MYPMLEAYKASMRWWDRVKHWVGRRAYSINRAWWWLQHRLNPRHRYHVLRIRDSAPHGYRYGWTDASERVLYAAFTLLQEFVEGEDPKVGLRPVEDYLTEGASPEEREMVTQQVAREQEVRALYDWWTKTRPEAYALAELLLTAPDGVDPSVTAVRDEKVAELLGMDPAEWVKVTYGSAMLHIEAEEQVMLQRLITVRQHLWT